MSGKAPHKRDLIDVIKAQQKITKKAAGISRANASGVIDASAGVLSAGKNQASSAGAVSMNAGADLNMHTYDIVDVDRLKFSVTKGSTDVLLTTDTGIESNSYYNPSNSTYYSVGMKYQIPTNQAHLFAVGGNSIFTIYEASIQMSVPFSTDSMTLNSTATSGVDVPTANGSIYYDGTDVKAKVPAGTINLTAGAGGANTALSNLTTTSINQDLIPSNAFKDLGETNTYWDNGYIFNGKFNNISISGTDAKLDMNNNPIEECGDIDFDATEHIKRSGVNYMEFQASKILIEKPIDIEADLEITSAYLNVNQSGSGAPSGTAKWFWVKLDSTTFAKVPCYT
tara:strand:- start:12785 stop:13804 length:1020 start_codon:yes stop_codon:yes gene_type:complete